MVSGLLVRAKSLRRHMTRAEQRLWMHLRGNRFIDVKFKRQKSIGPYIVDFVAPSEKLIVEVDGGQHNVRFGYDARRTQYLEELGYRVLRFWNQECLTQTDIVLEQIMRALEQNAPSPLTPLPQVGEGNERRQPSHHAPPSPACGRGAGERASSPINPIHYDKEKQV